MQNWNFARHELHELQGIISFLQQEGLLTTVKTAINRVHEMAGIAKKLDDANALLGNR